MGEHPSDLAQTKLTVAVVDDHSAVRDALVQLLLRAGLRAWAGPGKVAAAFEHVIRRRPDVTVMDIRLADGSGLDATRRILEEVSSLKILIYTGELVDPTMVDAILATGARGVALKTGDAASLLAAIRTVADGDRYIDASLRRHVGPWPALSVQLSEREREVLHLVGVGHSNGEIAEGLFLSPHTVRTHVRNALRKLGVHTRAEAVLKLERAESRVPGIVEDTADGCEP